MNDQAALSEFIQRIPLFELVQPEQMMDILRLLRPVTFEPGQVLFQEGEPGQAMWVLGPETEVAMSTARKTGGRPVVVAYAKHGETIGEMALVDEAPRSATATVIMGGPAHQIDATDFAVLREGYNPAAYKVLRKICMDLCAKLRATDNRIVAPSGEVIAAPPLDARPLPSTAMVDEFPPFRSLPQVVKLALAQKLKLVETDGVVPVFGEGAKGDAAYFVVEGEVTVGRSGKTLATMKKGALFGIVALIDQGGRSASCVTAGPAKLFKLEAEEFDILFQTGNRFAYTMVDLVARQLVEHIRHANAMLPPPGQGPARPPKRPSGPKPKLPTLMDPVGAAAGDEELEVLPLYLEL
jgi:CRP/FNR family transcriptional regulator, cyclic AMP receptor protein